MFFVFKSAATPVSKYWCVNTASINMSVRHWSQIWSRTYCTYTFIPRGFVWFFVENPIQCLMVDHQFPHWHDLTWQIVPLTWHNMKGPTSWWLIHVNPTFFGATSSQEKTLAVDLFYVSQFIPRCLVTSVEPFKRPLLICYHSYTPWLLGSLLWWETGGISNSSAKAGVRSWLCKASWPKPWRYCKGPPATTALKSPDQSVCSVFLAMWNWQKSLCTV